MLPLAAPRPALPLPAAACSLNRSLALAVLRAYGQLTPARFDEMLEHGLLPAPAKPAAAATTEAPQADEACTPLSAAAVQRQPEEAAAQV